MGADYLPLESQRRLMGLFRVALEKVVYGAKSQLGRVEDPYLLSPEYGSFVTLISQSRGKCRALSLGRCGS
jgi:hypothetical protein